MSRWHPHVGCIMIGLLSVPGSCHNMKMTLLKKIKKVVKFLMKLKVVHFFFFFWGKFSNSYVVMICNFAL